MKEILKQLGFEHLPMLSEFVKSQHGYWVNQWSDDNGSKPLGWIEQYTNFITTPLTKGMFVPCDRGGNALEKPSIQTMNEYHSGGGDVLKERINDFHEAREKVLFVGWYKCKSSSYGNIDVIKQEEGDELILRHSLKHGMMIGTTDLKTIEQAINAGVKLKLK